MTAVVPDVDVDVANAVDEAMKLPCERDSHGDATPPAELYCRELPCPGCGSASNPFGCCRVCWVTACKFGLTCTKCNQHMSREEGWEIIRWLT